MSTGKAATFTAGLVQMRSGLSPQSNLDAAVRLVEEAKRAGADYVLTPEMTNILEVNRERLFAAIAPEEKDATLAAFRELARKLGIFLHVGSLAIKLLPERAANRSFLIDRKGDIIARYDKIHMFDVELSGGESYRESRNYRPGESASPPTCRGDGSDSRSATICASPRSIARSPRPDARFSPSPRPSQGKPAKLIGMSSLAPARSRTAPSCWRPRRAASTRTVARRSAVPSSSILGAAFWPKVTPSRE